MQKYKAEGGDKDKAGVPSRTAMKTGNPKSQI